MKVKPIHTKTKQLGNSDLFITPVGFGAWAIGGAGWEFAWGEQDDKASIAAIHRALELGVNWIDTAAVYGMGHSEEVVARALKTWPGKRPYVFTKCALRWDEHGKVDHVLKADSIRRECEDGFFILRQKINNLANQVIIFTSNYKSCNLILPNHLLFSTSKLPALVNVGSDRIVEIAMIKVFLMDMKKFAATLSIQPSPFHRWWLIFMVLPMKWLKMNPRLKNGRQPECIYR